MTTETSNPAGTQAAQLQALWIACLQKVLSEIAGVPITAEAAGEDAGTPAEAVPDKPKICTVITAAKALQGEMAIVLPEPGALALAQTLMSEQVNAAVPFDRDRRDAYEELVRQVLGQVASSVKQLAGAEVELKLTGNEAPAWVAAGALPIRIAGEKLGPIHIALSVSPELARSMESSAEAKAKAAAAPPTPPPAAPPPPRPQEAKPAALPPPAASPAAEPASSTGLSANLELLLDVRVDASIRFGQKQMLLRDILELHPGSAVALDRQVQDPVELLVGGKVVAQGEVVIVDGNYGLRITEILTPQQRIESLGR